ncbi:3-keto-disaccharide hydrolase [Mariniflexile sp.]|uniref:3-keto-disaccharide hydrolase n=1 Tax=Mariniflexile sp. TaxID=1979402 RepID=UPI00404805D6
MKTTITLSLLVMGIVFLKTPISEMVKNQGNNSDFAIVEEPESGFKPLFNGKNFDDWDLLLRSGTPEEAKKVFTIDDDGTLHFFRDLPEGAGNDESRRNAFHGVMATKKSYSKYHLKFEYKWGKKLVNNYDQFQYDGGVFYHIMELKIWPVGLQYQVRYNHIEDKNHSGDFIASNVKMQWYSEDGETFKLPSEGGTPQPIRKGQHFAAKDLIFNGLNDKWNECEIIVMGNEYAIQILNGKLANMATNLEPSEGPIAFEAETGEIFWRNIRINEFDKSIPKEVFLKFKE